MMLYVYLIYGLSFFILWTVLWVYHIRLGPSGLTRNLWLIGLFAISHGLSDWISMLVVIGHIPAAEYRIVSLCLLALSFLLLMEFGIHSLGRGRNPMLFSLLPLLLVAPLGIVIALAQDKFLAGEIGVRYLLGIPGGLLTFFTLVLKLPETREPGLVPHLRLASLGFLFYTFFTGFIVPEAPFIPASLLNTRTLQAGTGIPVEIFRTLSVLTITYAMTRLLHTIEMNQAATMQRINQELEERVSARTAELSDLTEKLRARESQHRAILDNIPDLVWFKDTEGKFITVNAAFGRAAGAGPEELTGKTDFEAWPAELAEQHRIRDDEVIKTGATKRVEEPILGKNGMLHWIETIETPVYDGNGAIIGTTGIARDVTDRKQWADAMTAEQSFRKAIESSIPSGIAAVDLNGTQSYVNPAFCAMVGWSEQELVGAAPPFVYWPPENAEAIMDHLHRILEGKAVSGPHEIRFMRRNGDRFDALIQTSPFADRSGNKIGWMGSVTDITERKRVMEALRESEHRYRAITENALDVIITIDPDGRITFVNPAVERVFGYRADEVEGQSVTMLMPERFRTRHRQAVMEYIATGRRHLDWSLIELPGLHKNGREVALELSFGDFRAKGKRFFAGIIRDITARREMEDALRESERQRQLVMDIVPAMISYIGPDQRYRYVNRQYEVWFNRPVADFMGRSLIEVVGEEVYNVLKPHVEAVLSGKRASFENRAAFRGEDRDVHVDYVPNFGTTGEVTGFIALIMDVTERRQAERRLQAANEKLSSVLNSITEAYYALDAGWKLAEINREAERVLGPASQVLGNVYWELFPQNIGTEFDREYHKAIQEQRPVHFEARSRINSRWYEVHAYPRGERLEVYFRDVTERKRLEEIIRHRAYHDPLTDLPNRLLFTDIMRVDLAQARRNRKKTAVLFLDLDRFKEVNDTLGHDAGDELLQIVARRLKLSVRESDTVARIGGDEFNILLSDISDTNHILVTVRKIRESLARTLAVAGQEVRARASIGISIYPDDSRDIETLMKYADMAMYHAKEHGRNRWQFYDPAINSRTTERMALEKRLRRAIDGRELIVYYLPEVDGRTGTVIGAEALLRWKHPERGLLNPAEFIPLAEETGLIVPIGEWLLNTVAMQLRAWQQTGCRPISVTVNLSERQFRQRSLPAVVASALAKSGIEPGRLKMDISETVATADIEFTAAHCRTLAGMGVRLALDNFGTGHLSLRQLEKLPVEKLKIDRTLISEMLSDAGDRMVVEAMIAMAHRIHRTAAAEGVETEEQLRVLREGNCDEFEGYLFSRPVPAEELENMILPAR